MNYIMFLVVVAFLKVLQENKTFKGLKGNSLMKRILMTVSALNQGVPVCTPVHWTWESILRELVARLS